MINLTLGLFTQVSDSGPKNLLVVLFCSFISLALCVAIRFLSFYTLEEEWQGTFIFTDISQLRRYAGCTIIGR